MTLNDLIKHLEEIKAEHGGELPVWISGRDGRFERDASDVKRDLPFPNADKYDYSEGVLIK